MSLFSYFIHILKLFIIIYDSYRIKYDFLKYFGIKEKKDKILVYVELEFDYVEDGYNYDK